MRTWFILLLNFISISLDSQIVYNSVEDVPNQKLIDNSFVIDPSHIISTNCKSRLELICQRLEDSTLAQVAIVLLPSIGESVPKEFAVNLFNHWGIGQKESDNGLLILIVDDQKRIEFETGIGMEAILPDILCYKIQQNDMVPFFKEGEIEKGLITGLSSVSSVILREANKEWKFESVKSDDFNIHPLLKGYMVITLIVFLFYLFYLVWAFIEKDKYKSYYRFLSFTKWSFPILFPIPFLLLFLINKKLLQKIRNYKRISLKTGKLLKKLDNEEEKEFLSKGQFIEEELGFIDYDVWISDVENDILILPYSQYKGINESCPNCGLKTMRYIYNKVIKEPTENAYGIRERRHDCSNCLHQKIERKGLGKLTSSSGYYGSGSGGYSSGGYSSGGGSFGGGSSGGGGAGSSW